MTKKSNAKKSFQRVREGVSRAETSRLKREVEVAIRLVELQERDGVGSVKIAEKVGGQEEITRVVVRADGESRRKRDG